MSKVLFILAAALGVGLSAAWGAEVREKTSTPSPDRSPVDARVRQYAESLLRRYDTNKNGVLEKDEWSEMRSPFREADRNGDGKITLDEFIARFAEMMRTRSDRPRGDTYLPPMLTPPTSTPPSFQRSEVRGMGDSASSGRLTSEPLKPSDKPLDPHAPTVEIRMLVAELAADAAGKTSSPAGPAKAGGKVPPIATTPGPRRVGARAAAPAVLDVRILGPDEVNVGDRATFEIVITNRGSSAVTGIVIKDRFERGLVHETLTSPITRRLDEGLPPGQSKRIGVDFRAVQSGRLCQSVEVTANGGIVASGTASVTVGERPEAGPTKPRPDQQRPRDWDDVPAVSPPAGGSSDRGVLTDIDLAAPAESLKESLAKIGFRGRWESFYNVQLATADGQVAHLNLGQSRPEITGVTTNQFGRTNSIQYHNSGLIVDVKPRVDRGGIVTVQVEVNGSRMGSGEEGVPIFVSPDGEKIASHPIHQMISRSAVRVPAGKTVVVARVGREEHGRRRELVILLSAQVCELKAK